MKKKQVAPVLVYSEIGPVIVNLSDRVPGMSDSALNTLHANAVRLAQSGTDRQRASAGTLMPAIEAELALRQARALANKPVRKVRATAKAVAAAKTTTAPAAKAAPARVAAKGGGR
jgi:hypothetical protein